MLPPLNFGGYLITRRRRVKSMRGPTPEFWGESTRMALTEPLWEVRGESEGSAVLPLLTEFVCFVNQLRLYAHHFIRTSWKKNPQTKLLVWRRCTGLAQERSPSSVACQTHWFFVESYQRKRCHLESEKMWSMKPWKDTEGIEVHRTRWKKPNWKGCIVCDSNSTTFWNRQNYADSEKSSGCLGEGWGWQGDEYAEHRGFFSEK